MVKKISVVLSILLFASIASANTVEIRLDDVAANGININAFSLKFYDVGVAGPGGTYQHPADLEDFSFSWANPPQVTRVVWTLDNYPFDNISGDFFATGYAAFGPNTDFGALKDGLVVTLQSGDAIFGINPLDMANYINLTGPGSTNVIGDILLVNEEWVGGNQIITISRAPSSLCAWDIEPPGPVKDGDVDGLDIHAAAGMGLSQADLNALAQQFGRTNCLESAS